MNKNRQLEKIRQLEEQIKGAIPAECGKITKRLVKLKDEWLN